ncbi:hypothetical protein OHB05_00135 [Streptomyces sp. NBC_00638]|uniref:hypothetical protein n=1 Tax=unclassified Streptomyces TaxID=2593676 RepID=UPI00225A6F41|nr:hypothetical protein [Streptomyces sp. NBC_00638]MCX5001042.1 hypothetical protein [Streptomyces sp. NBC_00638]
MFDSTTPLAGSSLRSSKSILAGRLTARADIEGAHEKGGVEGQIGYFRRNHFVPVPEVSSLAELNEMVEQWDRQDDARRIGSRSRTIAEDFALERPLLMPLPEEPFETGGCSPRESTATARSRSARTATRSPSG